MSRTDNPLIRRRSRSLAGRGEDGSRQSHVSARVRACYISLSHAIDNIRRWAFLQNVDRRFPRSSIATRAWHARRGNCTPSHTESHRRRLRRIRELRSSSAPRTSGAAALHKKASPSFQEKAATPLQAADCFVDRLSRETISSTARSLGGLGLPLAKGKLNGKPRLVVFPTQLSLPLGTLV